MQVLSVRDKLLHPCAAPSELRHPLQLCCIGCPSAASRSCCRCCAASAARSLHLHRKLALTRKLRWHYTTAIYLHGTLCLHSVTTQIIVVRFKSCPRPVPSMLLRFLSKRPSRSVFKVENGLQLQFSSDDTALEYIASVRKWFAIF